MTRKKASRRFSRDSRRVVVNGFSIGLPTEAPSIEEIEERLDALNPRVRWDFAGWPPYLQKIAAAKGITIDSSCPTTNPRKTSTLISG